MDVKKSPHFFVCDEKVMSVVNVDTGKVVANPPSVKAQMAAGFDPSSGLVFASCGDGNLTVIHQDFPGQIHRHRNVPTKKSARTMAPRPQTHNIFLPAADFDAPAAASAAAK